MLSFFLKPLFAIMHNIRYQDQKDKDKIIKKAKIGKKKSCKKHAVDN